MSVELDDGTLIHLELICSLDNSFLGLLCKTWSHFFSFLVNLFCLAAMSNQQLIDAGTKQMDETDQVIERSKKVSTYLDEFLVLFLHRYQYSDDEWIPRLLSKLWKWEHRLLSP